jgi:hypothetical protein
MQKGCVQRLQKKGIIILLILSLFILSAAVPAVARDDNTRRFDYSVVYNIGGLINIDRQFGDPCTTGAVKTQKISGYGDLTKVEDVTIAPHIMTIDDKTDWSTAADAIRKLTVTTTIQLCSRPMSAAERTYKISETETIERDDIIHTYHPLVVDGTIDVYGLTSQIWATEVSTEPGNSGSYHADFIAAYGPGPYEEEGVVDRFGFLIFYDEKYRWWFDEDEKDGIDRGDYYVGNYFKIDHYAYTSGGELKRLISMSSPFYNTIFVEDLEVVGMAEVKESFNMDNIKPGPKAIRFLWWEFLF